MNVEAICRNKLFELVGWCVPPVWHGVDMDRQKTYAFYVEKGLCLYKPTTRPLLIHILDEH